MNQSHISVSSKNNTKLVEKQFRHRGGESSWKSQEIKKFWEQVQSPRDKAVYDL